MKLSQIAPSKLAEGRVDPHILMSLQRLAMGGKPETFSLIVIARLLELLKTGQFYKQANFHEVTVSTPKDVLDALRAMPMAELQPLAVRLMSLLYMKNKDELYTYANPEQETLTWLKWVALATSKEAND
jgi:hypothetical protein